MKKYAIKCTQDNKGLPMAKHFVNHPELKESLHTNFLSINYYFYVDTDGDMCADNKIPDGYEELTIDQANALLGVFPRKMLYCDSEILVIAEYKQWYIHVTIGGNIDYNDKQDYKELPTAKPIKKQLEERAKTLENELKKLKKEISKLD